MPFPDRPPQSCTPLLVVVAAACLVSARVPPAWAEPEAAAPQQPPLLFGEVTAPLDAEPVAPADPHTPGEPYEGGCLSCTGSPRLVPVCRRVPVKKKKPHTEYEMKCELVCVPGCGCLTHGHHGQVGCTDCDEARCDDMRVRKKKLLVKKVTEKETESYEYKVEWVCADCAAGRSCCGSEPARSMAEFFWKWFR